MQLFGGDIDIFGALGVGDLPLELEDMSDAQQVGIGVVCGARWSMQAHPEL